MLATVNVNAVETLSVTSEQPSFDQMVIVGNDTVSNIIPEKNYSRYDRGLFNYLYIPKGGWAFGLTASCGSFDTDDVQILSVLQDLDFGGKIYTIKPTVAYFFKNNQSVGVKFSYTNASASIGSLSFDFDEDLNFTLSDISYDSKNYGVSLFYRKYIGLDTKRRFGFFNDVDLSFGWGESIFRRPYNSEMRSTRTTMTKASLDFSPGVSVFVVENVSFNLSFGVFGVHFTNEKQKTNGVEDGSRFSSGANFRFNLLNINFGLSVHI